MQFFTGTNITAYYNAYFGESSGPYHLDGLGCNGYENNLTACSRQYTTGGINNNGIGVHNCAPGNEAGVKCDGMWTLSCIYNYMSRPNCHVPWSSESCLVFLIHGPLKFLVFFFV